MELVMHGEGRGRKEFVEVTRSMGIVTCVGQEERNWDLF
jgi:hypothetical protein